MIKRTLLSLTALIAVILLTSGCQIEKVSEGLYRGPFISKKRLIELKKLGVKTIVNVRLNPHDDSQKIAKEMGFKWFHIPSGVFIAPRENEWDQFLSIVRDPANQPIYLTCTIGADRTGFYLALYRMAEQGWTRTQAIEELHEGFSKWWRLWYTFYYYGQELKNWELLQNSIERKDILPNERTARGRLKIKPGIDINIEKYYLEDSDDKQEK